MKLYLNVEIQILRKMHNLHRKIQKIFRNYRRRAKGTRFIVEIVRWATIDLYPGDNFVNDRDVYRTQNGDVVPLVADGTLRMLNKRGDWVYDLIWDSGCFGFFVLKIRNSEINLLHAALKLIESTCANILDKSTCDQRISLSQFC